MITLRWYDGGIPRALDLAVDSVRDLTPIFKEYMAWLKPEIDKVFAAQGPGWSPLAESTKEAREAAMPRLEQQIRSGARRGLGLKLAREERKVVKRLDRRRRAAGAQEFGGRAAKLVHLGEKALARQERIRSEFERIQSGEHGPRTKADAREFRRLDERLGRADTRAEGRIAKLKAGELLGNIANSIGHEIKNGGLEVFSRIKWAGVHNDGGTAGHGARIPERRFLEWTPERVAKFAELANARVLKAFKG